MYTLHEHFLILLHILYVRILLLAYVLGHTLFAGVFGYFFLSIYQSMALQSFLGSWPLFQFFNPTHSW
jgi:hypothetical protein